MCKFIYQDLITKNRNFKNFFRIGDEQDNNFLYEITYGFMPRQFTNVPNDRYIYEQDEDITEMYFLLKGEWAVAFKCEINEQGIDLLSILNENDFEFKAPADMKTKGLVIA